MYDKENLKNIKEVRIITLGEPDVGKTSIIRRFVNDVFKGDKVTLGIEFSFKIVELEGNRKIKLSVIDTNGQEKYRALPLNYFKKADVVLFVFAVDNPSSFEKIGQWIDRFKNNNGNNVKKMFLIGNKSDLVKVIEQKEIDDFANKYGLTYMETSAKTKNQINELFTIIAEEAYEELERKSSMSVGTQKNKIVQKTNINNKSKANNCC
jgi:small GTP-binding protein